MSTIISDLDKSIQEGNLKSLYVFYGDEKYIIENVVD